MEPPSLKSVKYTLEPARLMAMPLSPNTAKVPVTIKLAFFSSQFSSFLRCFKEPTNGDSRQSFIIRNPYPENVPNKEIARHLSNYS
ncbi:hypothetical protein EVAR_41820_1 [Eumeta japonica]|uniref:Uncharacterized protein n=1 Tax=Eumeta variegata TaxID=151549 RepID=A0A4C1X8K4_EUMVA|nr:hypothetical protein EVAR_41820_1 [Eumeta japonica]